LPQEWSGPTKSGAIHAKRAATQRIAALAISLKEAELRILLELTRGANEDPQATQHRLLPGWT
jgi:hypothetical protein